MITFFVPQTIQLYEYILFLVENKFIISHPDSTKTSAPYKSCTYLLTYIILVIFVEFGSLKTVKMCRVACRW